jgi:hypothetical protein
MTATISWPSANQARAGREKTIAEERASKMTFVFFNERLPPVELKRGSFFASAQILFRCATRSPSEKRGFTMSEAET